MGTSDLHRQAGRMSPLRRLRAAPPSVLPDISPTRGEIGSFRGQGHPCGDAAIVDLGQGARDVRARSISPLAGEMGGSPEGGVQPQTLGEAIAGPRTMILPQELIRQKRDGGALDPEAIKAFIAGFADDTGHRGPGRGLCHGGVLPRDDGGGDRGADRGDARFRRHARLVRPRPPGRRQALDRRGRRQCLADARPDRRRLRGGACR